MNELSRTDAQRRADDIRVFRQELERLQAEHVLTLTEEQRHAIAQHHETLLSAYAASFDIDRDRRALRLSVGMRIASFLGAVALAASVFFLFSQYWGLFPTAVQVTLLITASLGTFIATFWIGRRPSASCPFSCGAGPTMRTALSTCSCAGGCRGLTTSQAIGAARSSG